MTSIVTQFQVISLGVQLSKPKTKSPMDKPSRQVNLNLIPTYQCPTHRWVISGGNSAQGPGCFDNIQHLFLSSSTVHSSPLASPGPDGTGWQVNKQLEQTLGSKESSARSILGFGKIQSNLPPISRLGFDYVDDKDCKQNSLSLLINSLPRTLKIFNYTV